MNLPAFVQPFLANHAGLSIFVFLLLFGFTLPISEEIALALAGMAARASSMGMMRTLLFAYPALILADLGYYLLARTVGPKLLRSKFFKRLVKPERVLDGEHYFEKRGPRILFVCRFVVGLRAPAIVAAGLLRMRVKRYLCYDTSAILISTPIWLAVGYAFGAQFDSNVGLFEKIFAFSAPVAVILGAIFVYRSVKKDRDRMLFQRELAYDGEPNGEGSQGKDDRE
jgi:membrane protein DedA with SNARE-associated domain